MKINRNLLFAIGLGLAALGLGAAPALAMPMNGLAPALAAQGEAAPRVETARWICGPYGGCRWVRGWRTWGPRPYWRPYYGYYRPWWVWRRPYYW